VKRSSFPAACRYWIQHTTSRLSRAVCPTGVHSAPEEIPLHYGSRTTARSAMSAHCFRRSHRTSDRHASQSADFGPESHWLLLGHDKLPPSGHRSEIVHLSSRYDFHGARRRRFLPAEYGHGRQIYGRSVGPARDTGQMARRVSVANKRSSLTPRTLSIHRTIFLWIT